MADRRLIETDEFAFEFLSRLAERESWRKEVHRPIYHVHKWWAKRLGTVFRGILLGCALGENEELAGHFYERRAFSNMTVFDPFMGSGSVGVATIQLGRRFVGNDKSPKAVALATRRLRSCMKSREEVVLSRANSKSYIAAPVRAFTRQLVAKVEVVTAQRIQAVIAGIPGAKRIQTLARTSTT